MSRRTGHGRGAGLWAVALLLLVCAPLPPAQAQPLLGQGDTAESIAVVIGNKNYRRTVPVEFAENDAEAMRDYVVRSLGFRQQNVVVLKDASLNELVDWFGTEADPQGSLWSKVQPGRSDVFVYYSGHGVPDLRTRQSFLLPSDGNPDRASSGYGLETLYRNLELIKQKVGPSRQVVVMLDACFTGETGRADGRGLLAVSAPGLVPTKPRAGTGVIKLVATSGSAPANWDGETKLGLFTSRFLMGAAGLALEPSAPSEAGASRSGQVSWPQLQAYLLQEVPEAARRDSRREQVPEIDAAAFSLPLRPPVPAVSKAVESVRDEASWRRAQAENTRAAYERYAALCGQAGQVCAHKDQAIEAAANSYLQEQSAAQAKADTEHWARASREGTYGAYRDTCRPPCAYKEIAARYAPEPPKVTTPPVNPP
ncbi:caspase family protein, partial [Methylorubrum extorquens]|uniref:caspase family protein n=1 Tax=Methylorubrum extorquens TaxID=408 RepID=UPI0011BED5E3